MTEKLTVKEDLNQPMHPVMEKVMSAAERHEELVQQWLEIEIIKLTPGWAHALAILGQFRGFRWMRYFPLPLVRWLTDVTVKTDTNMQRGRKGFRADQVTATQIVYVYKHGVMRAKKEFSTPFVINSPHQKLV